MSASSTRRAIEREITAPDSNRKILEELKTYALAHEERVRALPQDADLCRERFAAHLACGPARRPRHATSSDAARVFVAKNHGKPDVDRPLQRIREFRNRPETSIVVTVDMLSTGVDIPDLEFIVFLRPVKSRILFEQMLGRGTRKGEKSPDKSHFVVVDCFDGTLLEYFQSRASRRSRRRHEPDDSARSSRASGKTKTGSTHALPGEALAAYRQGDERGRARAFAPLCPTAMSARYAKELPGAQDAIHRNHGPLRNTRSRTSSCSTSEPKGVPRRAHRPGHRRSAWSRPTRERNKAGRLPHAFTAFVPEHEPANRCD